MNRALFTFGAPLSYYGAVVLCITILAASLFIPDALLPIDKTTIHPDSGCSYFVQLPDRPRSWPFLEFKGDNIHASMQSGLVLLEDSVAIGTPHSLHDTIRKQGRGGFSHWGSTLYFSTPTCDNPITNSRTYAVKLPRTLPSWLTLLSSSFFLLFLTLIVRARLSTAQARETALAATSFLLVRANLISHKAGSGLLLLLLLLATLLFLGLAWTNDKTSGLSLGGHYQISDAMGYWTCANALLDHGVFGNQSSFTREWCQRRAIYPSFLAGLTWIAQRNILFTLLLQASLLTFTIFIAARRLSGFVGFLGTLGFSFILFQYASVDAFPLTMTENAGLLYGCLALAALIKASEQKSLGWTFLGAILVSIALNARAGAFLVIPALFVWAGSLAVFNRRSIIKWLATVGLGITVGFAVQAAFVSATEGNPSSSHGNFSYVLYGLSVGGAGWQQVLLDHPEIRGSDSQTNSIIYALAISNIKESPIQFLSGVLANFQLFLSEGAIGYSRFGTCGTLIKFFWWISWGALVFNARNPAFLLLILLAAGTTVSGPFLIRDGGPRIFAATVPIVAAQIVIGATWLIFVIQYLLATRTFRFRFWDIAHAEDKSIKRGILSLELWTALIAVMLALTPYFLNHSDPLPPVASSLPKCPSDKRSVVTYLGANRSMLLNLLPSFPRRNTLREEVQRVDFYKGIPASAWYRDDLAAFEGGSLLAAYQLDRTDPSWPGPYLTVLPSPLPSKDYGKLAVVCLSKSQVSSLLGHDYSWADHIYPLE